MADTPISFDEVLPHHPGGLALAAESAAAELRNYKRHLLSLLTGEFGITWDDAWVDQPDLRPSGPSRLACAMPASMAAFAVLGPVSWNTAPLRESCRLSGDTGHPWTSV